jgi:hypothetical protein
MSSKGYKPIKNQLEKLELKKNYESFLDKNNIPPIKKLKDNLYIDFPDDVSEIPREDLGRFLGIYESEAAWLSYLLVRKKIEEKIAKNIISSLYNELFINTSGSPAERKAQVLSNYYYIEYLNEVTIIEGEVEILNTSLSAQERYAKVISREISNREKSDNWKNRVTLLTDSEGKNE